MTVLGYQVIKMDEFGQSNNQKEAKGFTYLFDMLDAVSLLCMCNKDTLVRQLSFVLLAESGKLKRLLTVPSDDNLCLNDLLIQKSDEVFDKVIDTLLIYLPFKQSSLEIFTREGFKDLFKNTTMEQLIEN